VSGQRHAVAALYPGKDPVPIVQEAGWAPGPVWTGAENLAPIGIQYPDRPARNQSLYRLKILCNTMQFSEAGTKFNVYYTFKCYPFSKLVILKIYIMFIPRSQKYLHIM
jgi:hypothetical protein